MKHSSRLGKATQIVTAIRRTLVGMLLVGSLTVKARNAAESALADVAQQVLDQDFTAARASMKRAVAADRSSKRRKLQESVNAVAKMPACLIAAFREQVGKEIRVNLPEGAETVRITEVDHQGNISAEKLFKANGRTVGATPRNFKLSDLAPVERFKLLGRDESPGRQIMRGLLAWESEKTDAAKSFFAKADNDLGKLLIDHLEQEQKAIQEVAAAKAYSAMLKIAGVESMRAETEKIITTIRRKRFSKADVAKIRRQLKRMQGELAKTKLAKNVDPVLRCFALLRPGHPLDVDQAVLEKALAKLNKDNPNEIIKAQFVVKEDGLALTLKNLRALTDLSGLKGIPLTTLTLQGCNGVSDLSPLKGMPLRELNVFGGWKSYMKVTDLSPLSGLPLERLNLKGLGDRRLVSRPA